MAEREVADLRKRLRLAGDEVRIWREKCELLEADLREFKGAVGIGQREDSNAVPTRGLQTSGISGETLEEPLYEAELSAIESALDKIYFQRAAQTGDLEQIRQQMLTTLQENAGKVLPMQGGDM